jgi:CBS domain-containing protein
MQLKDIIIPSKVARPGMSVKEAFCESIARKLPGIPFCDASGEMTGRISVKHVLSAQCIPRDMRRHADLLEDNIADMDISPQRLRALLEQPVDKFVLPNIPTISSHASPIKALALIEQYNTSYVFVVDDGRYLGAITLLGIVEEAIAEIT